MVRSSVWTVGFRYRYPPPEDDMTTSDEDQPHETRRQQGRRHGSSWAARAPLEEKVRLWEIEPDPEVEHYSRCLEISRQLKQELTHDERYAHLPHHGGWRTLYPLLEEQGLVEITSETDTWLAGFVDGALVAMGLEPHNS